MAVQEGLLMNYAGRNKYRNQDAPEKVIRYITRTNGSAKDDLVVWGGLGIMEHLDPGEIARQFYLVQKMNTRGGKQGRLVDHEVYSLSEGEERLVQRNNADIDEIARDMARDFYGKDHCQVVYGVHKPDQGNTHMHIHFAINTVDFARGRKRRENRHQTKEREARFREILKEGCEKR